MNVNEVVDVSIGLSVTPASQASFGVPLLLVDHADIPVDLRYIQVTRSSYATDLTASTTHLAWCQALWGQNYNPAQAYIGRWASAATASYCVCPSATQVASVYAALAATAQLGILEEGGAVVDIAPDFTGDTTMDDVCASLQTAMAGVVAAYTCTLDSQGRITITSDNTGAAAESVTLQSPVAGIDLTLPAYLGDEFSVAGLDLEVPGTAMSEILAKDNTPYSICIIGGSAAIQAAFSTAVNALDKFLFLRNNDINAIDSGDTTDAGYLIEALGHNKTHLCYTEHTTHYPDAALLGEVVARLNGEGRASMALNPLSGVSQSGLNVDGSTVEPLTVGQRTALENKGYDYLVKPSTVTHLVHGLAAGGNEVRVMIGKAFMAAKISEEIYGYLIANEVVTYSDEDIQAIKTIVSKWATEMAERGLLDKETFTWNFPEAADFSAATKATHTMALSNVFSADVLSAVNDITMTLSFSI